MIDWPAIFARDVAPSLANFQAPIPTPVLGGAGGAVLIGLAMLGMLRFPTNLAGLVPIAMVIFGGVMVLQGSDAAATGDTLVREGRLVAKDTRVTSEKNS
ncbi:MAG: hypothetical protein KC912_15625 [Proteobacteria bacterium]|nr:hypothetical protein [Pseudomonadota bacterium]